ncbi:MAG: HAD family hydrolase [Thermoplasmatota archaeon]
MKESELVIFDFDGTLFSIDIDWKRLYSEMSTVGREYGHVGDFDNLIEAYRWAANVYGAKRRLVEVQDEFESGGISSRRVDRGAAAARWRLERGKPSAVLSLNTSYTLDAVVGSWGFYPVVTIDKVERPKPDPQGLDMILGTLKLTPGDAVFIGNSDIDRRCARARSMTYVDVALLEEEWFR